MVGFGFDDAAADAVDEEGRADQVKGKVQNTIGGVKDTLRGKDNRKVVVRATGGAAAMEKVIGSGKLPSWMVSLL
mgnify:CR=1 FL=1